MFKNISGNANLGIGTSSLKENISGYNNVAVGFISLLNNTTGYYNTGVGFATLANNTTGIFNTATGGNALTMNVNGESNSAYSDGSLYSNVSGNYNSAYGRISMFSNLSGSNNIAFGYQALYRNTIGNNNVSIGALSFTSLTNGSNNTAIGYNTKSAFENSINSTAIGANSKVDCDNCLVLGSVKDQNNATSSVRVGIGTTNPEPSAVLELKSTTQGLLLPRMTISQRDNIINPAQGLVIFCINCGPRGQMSVFDGVAWTDMNGNATKPEFNLNNGLVAFYPFSGNAGDSSGNQYHATVKGAILTENRFGIPDKAYEFDGINSRIEIPVFSAEAINKEFTFSMWVFNKPTNDAQSFFLRQGPNGVSKTWILKYSNQTSIQVYNENSYYGSFNSPNLKENEWYHLTVTIKDSIVCVFVNGVNIGCSDIGFPFNYSQNLNILGHAGGTGNQNYPFSGKMDEVRFYNRVLTQEEISFLVLQ
jgi:hypothetical protein